MSVEITMVMAGVALAPTANRQNKHNRCTSVALELMNDSCRAWDDVECGELYHYSQPVHGLPSKLMIEMPHFDAVFKYLAGQRAINRSNPLGAFLNLAVSAMETALAAKQGSSVYFAEADGRIKIGYSRQVAARVNQIQTGNAAPIKLLGFIPGGLAREREIHAQFASARLNGEWFTATPELLAFIASAGAK